MKCSLRRGASHQLAFVLVVCTMSACGSPRVLNVHPMAGTDCTAAPPARTSKTVVIGVSLQEADSQFYHDIKTGICDEAARFGYRVDIDDAGEDAAKQDRQVRRFVDRKVSAIIVTPYAPDKIVAAFGAARKKGIPVFTIDIADVANAANAHITSNNKQGGTLAGQMMCDALRGRGRAEVAIVDVGGQISSVRDRVGSFGESLAACGVTVTVVEDNTRGGDRAGYAKATSDMVRRYSHLAGIFAINDDAAMGASRAVDEARLTGTIAIVGYDGTPEAHEAIAAGVMYGDVVQHPDQLGSAAVDAVRDYRNGRRERRVIMRPVEKLLKDAAEK
jgi:ABC-type sugar transport system substrate-binding protein